MGNPIGGTAFVFAAGTQFPLRGNLVIGMSEVERTGVAGQDGVHGYTEMPVVPYMEGDFSAEPDMEWDVVATYTNITVQANLINGESFVLRNAWVSNRQEMNTREGIVHVRFEGMQITEVPAPVTG